jgi:uncharacterized protein
MSAPPRHGRPARPAAPGWFARLKARVAAEVPSREALEANRWLRPVAHRLAEPGLWHMRAEAVARGVAIGMFWAFVIPFAQIIFAAAHCVWWRGNIPTAAAITFITNPFTVGGWLYLAYQVGTAVLPARLEQTGAPAAGEGVLAWIQSIGLPAVVGMGLFAVVGAVGGYLLVHLVSAGWRRWRMRQALARRAISRTIR